MRSWGEAVGEKLFYVPSVFIGLFRLALGDIYPRSQQCLMFIECLMIIDRRSLRTEARCRGKSQWFDFITSVEVKYCSEIFRKLMFFGSSKVGWNRLPYKFGRHSSNLPFPQKLVSMLERSFLSWAVLMGMGASENSRKWTTSVGFSLGGAEVFSPKMYF